MTNFALIGAAGYIAPRHLKAIKDTGNELVAAIDPHDNVGILDSYFPDSRFFTEIERFDRHLEKLRREGPASKVNYVSICSPNYLHDAHIRLALRLHAHAICEKPLVINPWNLDALKELETEYDRRVYTIFQLRRIPSLMKLKAEMESYRGSRKDVVLTYITRRGRWYDISWKGKETKSGGVAMNIGVHFFDIVQWLFGPAETHRVTLRQPRRIAGCMELPKARVRWFLSVDGADLPDKVREKGGYAFRTLKMDGSEIEFSGGFSDLHTDMYQEILAGRGFGIDDASPAIQAVYDIRQLQPTVPDAASRHPLLDV